MAVVSMQNVMDASIWICSDAAVIEKNDSDRRQVAMKRSI
jgi:hypothetical protein